jgi:hypothetical protein
MFLNSQKPALMLAALLFAVWPLGLAGTNQKAATKPVSITITGCVQPGRIADRFILYSPKGKTYALRSSSVKLADHVGHSVTITGALKRDPQRDNYEFEGSEINEEWNGKAVELVDVDVTSVKAGRGSCQ